VAGDLDDPTSVRAAMQHTPAVFAVLNMMSGRNVTADGVAAEQRRGRTIADVAAELRVDHVVYSSIAGAAQRTGVPQVDSKGHIERHFSERRVPVTVLRPVFFMDNFTSLTRPVLSDGELIVSLPLRPDTPLSMIATSDIGEFAALAFDDPAAFPDEPVVIAGDRLTGVAIAERFAGVAGVPARFTQAPIERIRAFDENVAAMFAWLDTGRSERPDLPALHRLHPGLLSLDNWLRESSWRPQPLEVTR
jgi:uncharacterized protein YbjT (DUF2867 family)